MTRSWGQSQICSRYVTHLISANMRVLGLPSGLKWCVSRPSHFPSHLIVILLVWQRRGAKGVGQVRSANGGRAYTPNIWELSQYHTFNGIILTSLRFMKKPIRLPSTPTITRSTDCLAHSLANYNLLDISIRSLPVSSSRVPVRLSRRENWEWIDYPEFGHYKESNSNLGI